MLNGLIHAHSGLRWIVLLLLVLSVFKALMKWRSDAPYNEGDRKLHLFTLISVHTQLLLGALLFFMSNKVSFGPETMSNPVTRFFTAEHSVMMLLAIVLITIGYSKSKRAGADTLKSRTIFIFFGCALLAILAGIPWPFRNLGAGWF